VSRLPCTCTHQRPDHRRGGGRCKAADSYGILCLCPAYEPDEAFLEYTLAQARELAVLWGLDPAPLGTPGGARRPGRALPSMPMTAPDVACPNCPVCGQAPALVISGSQAFCANDDCRTLMWDPTQAADVQLANEIVIPGLLRDDL
jgi:hypothetical protein